MSERMTSGSQPVDPALTQKKRARRRLIGAVSLSVVVAGLLWLALDHETRPVTSDLLIKMSPREGGEKSRSGVGAPSERESVLSPPPDNGPAAEQGVAIALPTPKTVLQEAPAGAPAVVDTTVSPPQVIVPASGKANAAGSGSKPSPVQPPFAAPESVFAPFPDPPPPPPLRKSDTKTDSRANSTAESPAVAKPGAKGDQSADSRASAKREVKPEPKTSAKAELKGDKKADAKAEQKLAAKVEKKVDTKPVPKFVGPADDDDPIAQIARSRGAVERPSAANSAREGAVAPRSGPYRLQVGAFSSESAAAAMAVKVRAAGLAPVTEKLRGAAGTSIIRVRVGQYKDREAAQRGRESLASRGIESSVIAP